MPTSQNCSLLLSPTEYLMLFPTRFHCYTDTYMDFSTKFPTYRRRYLIRYTQCSQPVNFNTEICTLQHHLTVLNLCLMHTTQNRALPNVSENRCVPNVRRTCHSSTTLRTKLNTVYQHYKLTLRFLGYESSTSLRSRITYNLRKVSTFTLWTNRWNWNSFKTPVKSPTPWQLRSMPKNWLAVNCQQLKCPATYSWFVTIYRFRASQCTYCFLIFLYLAASVV